MGLCDTLPTMVELIDNAIDLNPKLKACAILTMSPTKHNINKLELARSVFKFDNLILLKSVTSDRKVYRDAASIGLSVLEMDNEKASFEISEIATEIFTMLKDS